MLLGLFFPSFAQANEEKPLYLLCTSEYWSDEEGKNNIIKEEEEITFSYYIELKKSGTGISEVFDYDRLVPFKKYRTYSKFRKTPSPTPRWIYLEYQKNDSPKTKESYEIDMKNGKFKRSVVFEMDNPRSIFFDKVLFEAVKKEGIKTGGIFETGTCKPTFYLPRDEIEQVNDND